MSTELEKLTITEEERKELELFQQLKPYLHYCLTLNHDLNNPLAGIIGYSEFLLDESNALPPEQLEYVKRIIVCAERMEKLIGKMCEVKSKVGVNLNLREITDQYNKLDSSE